LAIAGNRCRTALAHRKRRPACQSIVEQPAEKSYEKDDAAHLTEEVEHGLRLLRDEYRESFILFHEHGFSYEQIAQHLHRPLGTVKTWIHRARKELMEYLLQKEVVPEYEHVVRDV
jgi:RNA polymerase sigma-70 factor (ECF subfamily)